MNNIMKIKFITYILILFIPSFSFAEYPNTSIGVIDINKILAESDAAVMASKQIEEIAERAQKQANLASIGEIATAISHEVNQPISAIEIYAKIFEIKKESLKTIV